jgi:hypothetical protein
MDEYVYTDLYDLANRLSNTISRYQLGQLKQDARQGEGVLAGLSRYQIGEVERLYEKIRLERGL